MGGRSTKFVGGGNADGSCRESQKSAGLPSIVGKAGTAKLSSFQKFLATHRCVECNDVLIPKFTAGHASKAQRTCTTCSRVACHKCFKESATLTAFGSLMCKSCRSTKCAAAVVPSTASQDGAMVVSLKRLSSASLNGIGWGRDSLLFLICAFASEHPDALLRNVLRSWLEVKPCFRAVLCGVPPHSSSAAPVVIATGKHRSTGLCGVDHDEEAVETRDDESPGSPTARIPDFSEALRQTSGDVMSALRFSSATTTTAVGPKQADASAAARGGHAAAATPSKPNRHPPAAAGITSGLIPAKHPQLIFSPQSTSSRCSTKLVSGLVSPAPAESGRSGQPQYLQVPKTTMHPSTPSRNASCSPMVTPSSRGPLSSRREADINRSTGGKLTTSKGDSHSKSTFNLSPRVAQSQSRGWMPDAENHYDFSNGGSSNCRLTKIRASASPLPLRNTCAPRGTPRPTPAREASRSPLSFVRTDSSTLRHAADYHESA